MIDNNLLGELRIMNDFHIKSNYSALARKYNMDRHIIKKYYENGKIPDRKKSNRTSKWDKHYDEIQFLISLLGVNGIIIIQNYGTLRTCKTV